MLSEDEKKAINYLNNKINENKKEIKNIESKNDTSLIGYGTLHETYKLENWYYLILLNLIEKLQKENEEKDKQIELTTKALSAVCTGISSVREQLEKCYCEFINSNEDCCWKTDKGCKDCIFEYFEKLAKKDI